MQSQLDTSRYARSILSSSTRRDVLWNVSEPGDPYDIKKSMIAKLPGDKKVFMGDQLELVCLLQAAEIERLCEFLDDYRLKFREIERNNLDRHSYEVQIKELTERLSSEESIRNENSKLKEFSKRLQGEIEFMQSSTRQSTFQDEANKANYEKTLERLSALTTENQELRRQTDDYRFQLQNFTARFEALERAKNREIEELKLSFTLQSRETYESSLTAIRAQGEAEIRRLEFELKRMRELNDAKNAEINELQIRVKGLSDELQRVGLRSSDSEALAGQVREYENKFVIFGTEIKRLNDTLRDYTNKLEESERRRRELDAKTERLEQLNAELDARLRAKDQELAHLTEIIAHYEAELRRGGDTQQVVSQYESQLVFLTQENENLNGKLKLEIESGKRLKDDMERLVFENSKYRLLERENAALKEGQTDAALLKKKLVELENRTTILTQEVERLQQTAKTKDSELERLRTVAQENDSLRTRISQLEYSYTSRSEIEISRIRSEYEQRFQELTRSQGTEFQSRIQSHESEIHRLGSAYKAKGDELEQLRSRAYEMEVAYKRAEVDTANKIKNYELAITNFKRENEELYARLKTVSENERKVLELQNKLTQYEREIERLTLNLKNREEEILSLRTKLRDAEGLTQRYEFEVGKSKSSFEQNITTLRSDNESLTRKLNENIEKLRLASVEIDRLGGVLRKTTEERAQFEGKWKQAAQEGEYLKQGLQKSTGENEELRRRIGEYEVKLNALYNEGNTSIRTLTQENEQLKKQLSELKNQANLTDFETNKKITIIEQNLNNLARENEDLKRKLNDYEARIALASQEIERLSIQLRTKSEEYNALKTDSEKFRSAFKQYEADVNSHMEGEVKTRFLQYEQRFAALLQENEELKRVLADNANKYNLEFEKVANALKQATQEADALRNELKKLTAERREESSRYELTIKQLTVERREESSRFELTIKQLTADNDNIRRQFKEYDLSVTQKFEGELGPKMASLQETVARLNKENDELKRKLQEVGTDLSRKISEGEARYVALSQEYATLGQEYEKLRATANGLAQENDGLRKKGESYEVSITNYEAEVKKRFAVYEQNNAALYKEGEDLRRKLQELSELNRKLADYEISISMLSQELERLQAAYKAATQENEGMRRQISEKHALASNLELEVSRKANTYESNLALLQKNNEELTRRLADSDQKLKNLSLEFEKLNNAYRLKTEEYSRLEINIKNYESEVKKTISNTDQNLTNLARENEELKKQLNDSNRRGQDFENRLALISQELERLGFALKAKQEENAKLDTLSRNQANEIESWRKRYGELEAGFNKTYEFEVKKKYSAYEQTISEFNRRNTDTEARLNGAIQDVERLNNTLRLKLDESTQQALLLKTTTAELDELRRRTRDNDANYSQNANALKRDNDELRRRLQEAELMLQQLRAESERRQSELEARLKTYGQEVERLTGLLRSKSEELEVQLRKYKEFEVVMTQKFEGEVKGKYGQYESHLAALVRENDDLRKKLQEAGELNRKLAEYENKIVLLSQENDRLNGLLAARVEDVKKTSAQGDELRRKLQETVEITRRIPEYEQRVGLLMQENEKLQVALRGKTDELGALDAKFRQLTADNEALRKNMANLEYSWTAKYESELTRRTQTYEQTVTASTREREELQRKIKDAELKIALCGQEIERLNGLLRTKTEENGRLVGELESLGKKTQVRLQSTESEYSTLQVNYSAVLKEYETAKRHLQEYETSIRKLYTEFERLQGIINELKKENQTLHTMNHNLSGEINRLTLENKDLEEQASEVRLRLTDESALQKRINEHLALMVVLFAEIETLRNRVKDKEKEVAEVRRSSLAPNIL